LGCKMVASGRRRRAAPTWLGVVAPRVDTR
jgi:hypothetical protein